MYDSCFRCYGRTGLMIIRQSPNKEALICKDCKGNDGELAFAKLKMSITTKKYDAIIDELQWREAAMKQYYKISNRKDVIKP